MEKCSIFDNSAVGREIVFPLTLEGNDLNVCEYLAITLVQKVK